MKKKIFAAFAAFAFLAADVVGQSSVSAPVTSIWNIVDNRPASTIAVIPLTGSASAPVATPMQIVGPGGSFSAPGTISVTFAGQASSYTLVGIQASVSSSGVGFTMPQPAVFAIALTPLIVPAQVPLTVSYNAPLTGLGMLTAAVGVDASPPTAPLSLSAAAVGTSQIALAWTAAADNVAVASYLVERCQTAGCTTFAQIGSSVPTSYSDLALAAGVSYSYRVYAVDAAGNPGPYSNVATAVTQAPAPFPMPTPGTMLTPIASDSFAAALTGRWTTVSGESGFKASVGFAVPNSLASDAAAYYSAASFPLAQYSRGNLSVTGSASPYQPGIGLAVRVQAGADTYYRFVIDHSSTKNAGIGRRVAGSYTTLVQWTQAFADGDQFAFAYLPSSGKPGGVLYVLDKNLAIVKTFDDSAAGVGAAPGAPGIIYSSTDTAAAVKNWEGGTFAPQ